MKREHSRVKIIAVLLIALSLVTGIATKATAQDVIELRDERVENTGQYNMSLQDKVITGR